MTWRIIKSVLFHELRVASNRAMTSWDKLWGRLPWKRHLFLNTCLKLILPVLIYNMLDVPLSFERFLTLLFLVIPYFKLWHHLCRLLAHALQVHPTSLIFIHQLFKHQACLHELLLPWKMMLHCLVRNNILLQHQLIVLECNLSWSPSYSALLQALIPWIRMITFRFSFLFDVFNGLFFV